MALISRQVTRTSQPQELVGIDRAILNPELLFLGSAGGGNLGNPRLTFTGAPSAYRATQQGTSAYFNGSSPGRLYSSVPAPNNTPFTLLIAFTPDAAPSGATYTAPIFTPLVNLSWDHANSAFQGAFAFKDGGGMWRTVALKTANGLVPTVVCVTYIGGTLSLFQDGVLCGSVTASYSYEGGFWDIGERGDASGYFWPGHVSLAAVANQGTTVAIAKSLSENPWRLFEPATETLWIPDTVAAGHTLTAANSDQSATSGTGSLTQSHNLAGANCAQSATSGTGAIVSGTTHVLTVASDTQSATSGAGAIAQAHTLTGAASSQSATSGTGTLTQAHTLTGANSTQDAVSGTGAISTGLMHVLTAAASSQSATSSAGSITQTHALISAPSVQDSIASASAIVQAHVLAGENCSQSAISGAGSINARATPAGRLSFEPVNDLYSFNPSADSYTFQPSTDRLTFGVIQ